MNDLLTQAAERSARYIAGAGDMPVAPKPQSIAGLAALGGALPENASDPLETLALLDELGSPATVASTGGRYFGFVIGGALPVAVAANWLAGAWDQNAGLTVSSPVAAKIEEIVSAWLIDLVALPHARGTAFVTGTTMANFAAIAAARSALLQRSGWNVEENGLFGAPPINVVLGQEVHASLLKALSMLGLGRARATFVPTDDQGRMVPEKLPPLDDRTLVCIQAGNVNTGAFDPAEEICSRAGAAGAWVHVDGAFGLCAAISPRYAHLVQGVERADSWALDCHKWLNVPYDSGVAFVRDPEPLRRAMAATAAYLPAAGVREPCHYTPEISRRARGIELWAALRACGRAGFREIVERNCRLAGAFADGLRAAGFDVLNDVVFNQVLVAFGDAERTRRVIAAVQADGTCWCGGTEWHGRAAMRISVSNWSTTDEDVARSLAAIVRLAND